MGGAFGALGADLASQGLNPAGIGMYRRSDAGGSIVVFNNSNSANLGEYSSSASKSTSTIGTFGVALTTPSVNPDAPFVTLAISHQKRALYDGVTELIDARLNSSLLGVFREIAEGTSNAYLDDGSAYPYNSSLAWYCFLLDPNGSSNTSYVTPFNTDSEIAFSNRIEESGELSETQFSLGSTFKKWLSVGATISKTDILFTQDLSHSETPLEPGTDLSSWTYNEHLFIEGSGLNIKLGAIAHADWLKLGIAWHSGTRYTLTDYYSTSMSSSWKDGTSYSYNSPDGGYEYSISTPSRLILSSSVVMGKFAILSADYENVDYSTGKLRSTEGWMSDGYDFEAENTAVADSYTRSHEARLGLEMRLNKNFRARLGAGASTSPYSYESGVLPDPSVIKFSLGGEYRIAKYYAGFAWSGTWYEEDLYVINPDIQGTPIHLDRSKTMVVIGGGMRF
jgi:hypothetical protein